MTNRLTSLLAERAWLLADGATGSNLFNSGLQSGDAPELWNDAHPERISALHRAFVEAGADIILTNSFGGTRHRLKLHKAEGRVAELNEQAARLARAEADRSGRVVLVGGSVGPTGEILEPLGPLSQGAAVEAFAEQAGALARGGADLIWIETMSSVEETEAAVAGARTTSLPVVATLSFDTNGRTMMGITPSEMADYARLALDSGARIIGGCCGTTPEHLRIMRQALEAHVRAAQPDLATIESRLGAISTGAQAQLRGELSREAGAAAGARTRRTTSHRGARA
jgi:5-methyltetrahydrofolate--homocysteine methyltransferase